MTGGINLNERTIDSSIIGESLDQILCSTRFRDCMQLQTGGSPKLHDWKVEIFYL